MECRTFLSTGLGASLPASQWDACLPDFSNCGYAGGGVQIPKLPVRLELNPESRGATERIQAAIERRWGGGVVFPLADSARIRNSGVERVRGVSAFDRTVTHWRPR